MSSVARASLRTELDRHYAAFNRAESATDPIELVRPFHDPADREIAAFCSAALAFGRVGSVLASVRSLFDVMGPRPAEFVRRFEPARDARALDALVHRWTRGRDLAALVLILQAMLAKSGSLENFFLEGFDPAHTDVGPALDSFVRRAREVDLRPVYGRRLPARPGVYYFFPCPSAGSGCKRLNLFLRWMVRRDQVDLGAWTRVPAAALVVPLDTHVIRLGRCLGLTRYASPGWRMAKEITESLRAIDPVDPVKYDFSLCHLGMMNACGFGRRQGDAQCPLKGLCTPRRAAAGARREAARRPRAFPAPSARR